MQMRVSKVVVDRIRRVHCSLQWHAMRMKQRLAAERGQGTTEYAILVGILVVIAILAITIFRPKIEELWKAISDAIMGL